MTALNPVEHTIPILTSESDDSGYRTSTRSYAYVLFLLGSLHVVAAGVFAPYVPHTNVRDVVIASVATMSIPYFFSAVVLLTDRPVNSTKSGIILLFSLAIVLTIPSFTFIQLCRVSNCLRYSDPLSTIITAYMYFYVIAACALSCIMYART